MFSSAGTVSSTIKTNFREWEKMTISGRSLVAWISGGKTSLLSLLSTRSFQSEAPERRFRRSDALVGFFGLDLEEIKES